MLLPNGNGAYVDQTKITDYLLSLSHPDGRNKAKFFLGFGFKVDEWQRFADALKEVGILNPVVNSIESVYGVRYTVDGLIKTPDGRTPKIRTIWFIERQRSEPRLITAYPV